jgi:hypothetical protein
LVSQLDELVGDTGLHSLSKRREAERRFDAIVVSAFYEPMEGAVVDDATAICEVRVPLRKNGVSEGSTHGRDWFRNAPLVTRERQLCTAFPLRWSPLRHRTTRDSHLLLN